MRLLLLLSLLIAPLAAAADWPTHRGNHQRTGNVDQLAGPQSPKVLWVHKSQEHFIAAPVAAGRELFVSGLGAFNSASFRAFSLDLNPSKQEKWAKSTPYLKLPVVSSPAIADGKLVFGDGMHQTDGAILHCLRADSGLPLWQFPVPGKLVHMEGSPTIANGKVVIGGGNAGVLCVDLNRVTLDGKELTTAAVQVILEQRWQELVAKYEADKKKDPDFAVPPSEDALPKPAPVRLWQQGQDKWHVDAPVAAVGERVLAASAFLEKEGIGECALFSLALKDGAVQWNAPLRYNPWGGPTIAGDVAIVGCSNIRFEPAAIPTGKGEIVAIELAGGAIRWRKEIPGGIVSPVAVAGELVISTATDGKIRAWTLANGHEKWTYDAKAPLFAGVAVAGNIVYTADLKGNVHAVNLGDGKVRWTLNLGTDPSVGAGGMVYGSPIVHGGRLYLATCNLEGDHARQPTVVVCIGEK